MSAPFSALALSAAISKCPWKISEMHCSPRILLRFWIYSAVSICTVNKMSDSHAPFPLIMTLLLYLLEISLVVFPSSTKCVFVCVFM